MTKRILIGHVELTLHLGVVRCGGAVVKLTKTTPAANLISMCPKKTKF